MGTSSSPDDFHITHASPTIPRNPPAFFTQISHPIDPTATTCTTETDIDITSDLQVLGPGPDIVPVTADDNSRVFDISGDNLLRHTSGSWYDDRDIQTASFGYAITYSNLEQVVAVADRILKPVTRKR